MRRKGFEEIEKKEAKLAEDLHVWQPEDVPAGLRSILGHNRVRLSELGLIKTVAEFEQLAENAKSNEEILELEYQLRRAAWKVINLMRLNSGLAPTKKPIEEWPQDELVQPHWGNDYTPCSNPVNKNGTQNTTSPRPGWFYREVELNWLTVLQRLEDWKPEEDLRPHVKDNVKHLEDHPRRKAALEMFEEMEGIDRPQLKAMRDKSKKLEDEVNGRAAENKKKLEEMAVKGR